MLAGTNTAGTPTVISSGTLYLAGGTNVTLSQQGNSVTIQGATVAGQPVNFSAGATSGNLASVVFSNSNALSFGLSGSTITGSYTVPSTAGLLSAVNLSAGATSGNLSAVTFSNAGGVSFGLSGSTLTASVATNYQSQGAYLTTAALSQDSSKYAGTAGAITGGSLTLNTAGATISLPAYLTTAALSGDTTKYAENWKLTGNTSGTTSSAFGTDLWLAGGNGVTLSGSSNTISLSVATNYQSQGAYLTTAALSGDTSKYGQNWKLTGNTSGTTSSAFGTDLWIAGGNNITISGNSNSITISGANAGGAQTGISGIVGSNATYTSGTVQFSGVGGGITVSSNTGQRIDLSVGAYITTAALSGDTTKYVQNWKLTGNTSGTTSSAQGTDLWLAGGNGVTVSGNSNSITISVATNYQSQAAYLTTADLSANSSKYAQNWKLTGNTSGTTSSAFGTDLWLAGGNGVTLSGNSNSVTVSVATNYQSQAAYLTTAALSGDTSKYAGINGAITGGSITVNTSGVSVNLPAYLTTADLSANSSKYVQNWKLTGNTSGTTSSAQGTDLWLAGGNGVTLSGSSNSVTVSVATNYQSQGAYLTTAALSGDTSKYAQNWKLTGNTAGTTSSAFGTDLWIAGGSNITVSGSSNSITIVGASVAAGSVTFSAGTASGALGSVVFSNSNGVGFGLNGSTITAAATLSVFAGSNTSGTSSGTAQLTNLAIHANNALSAAASNGGWELYSPATSSLSATGWVQISTNGSTISIGATTTANLYAVGNTFGTSSGTADPRTVSISADSGLQAAASNSGWLVGVVQVSQFDPFDAAGITPVTNSTLGQNSVYFCPFDVPAPVSASRLNLYVSVATGMSAANSTGRAGYTISAALYSRQTGASTDRIASFWSMTAGMSATQNSNSQLVMTNLAGILNSGAVSTVGTTLSTSNATTYLANSVGGYRVIPLPLSTNLTQGRYWLAVANSTTASNANVVTLNCSVMQLTNSLTLAFAPFGTSSVASNASFPGMVGGYGTYSATSGGFPSSVPLTSDSIRMGATNFAPYFNISGYSNSANGL